MFAVETTAESLRLGNSVCDLAMIKIGSEGRETGPGKPRAESFDGVVKPPLGVEDQYALTLAGGRDGEKALRLRMCHVDSLE